MQLKQFKVGHWALTGVAVALMLLGTGCEELLNEALNKEFTVEETLFPAESATADEATVDVAQGLQLSGGEGVGKAAAGLVVEVQPAQAALLAWVMSEGGGVIQGSLENRDANPVVFKLSLGSSNNWTEAELVGSVNLGGGESRDFSFSGTALESFFASHFAAGLETLYLFLSAEESSTVNLWISHLQAVLQPAFYMQQSIGPLADFTDYADSIGDITDLGLSGSITNNGASDLELLVRIRPVGDGGSWEGLSVGTTIAAGQTFNLDDWSTLFDADMLASLEDAIAYLATGTIKAELFLTSPTAISAQIVTIVLHGSVNVGL